MGKVLHSLLRSVLTLITHVATTIAMTNFNHCVIITTIAYTIT